jgi:hypothetical protein
MTMRSVFNRQCRSWLTILVWMVGTLVLSLGMYFLLGWPWLSRWGATTAEVGQTLPGDELIANPAFVTTKAVTIQASPEAIWPWLVQLGVDRGGMYSYLWVENWLLRLNVQNSNEIRPEWQSLRVGDFIRFTPADYALNPGPGLYVMAIEPNRALIGCFGLEGLPPECGKGATWQFVLEPHGNGATRLILRSRSGDSGPAWATAAAKVAQAFQFYMERKMLIEIQARAESLAIREPLARASSIESTGR